MQHLNLSKALCTQNIKRNLILIILLVGVSGMGLQIDANSAHEEKIVVTIANDATGTDYTLYTLQPNGSGQTALFDSTQNNTVYNNYIGLTPAGDTRIRTAPVW